MERIRNNLKLLAISIYQGDRLERNLKVISWIGFVIALVSGIMTGINIFQHKGFVTYTTAVACLCGIVITISGLVLKNRKPAIIAALFVCIFIFSYYTLFGVNDGFAILWTFLVPLAFSYFAGVIYGVGMSVYYEVLFIVLFYTPLRSVMGDYYGDTFMDRFPMLYLCGVMLNCVAMIHYHVTTLAQMDYEKKLKEAADAAISAGEAKSQFLAQMSHEIRTPINAILGMNEMILREATDESVKDYSESIQESGKTLLSLINSILDFSKIEDGKMEILPVKYNTMNLIHNLVATISERAKAKELEFRVEVDENLPKMLLGDDVRITQVVANLLTNAVKYTETGHVSLMVKDVKRVDDRVLLQICVEDTGIGIRMEDREKLFETFERLDVERNRNIEGTGLGMAIVLKLLAMMDSKIELDSAYGKGSSFFFQLWQEIVDETPMGKYTEKVQRDEEDEKEERYLYAPDANILITDDNEMNLKVVTHLLKRCGIKPDLAKSGPETIEKVRQKQYDVILLDHMMPRMDGLETLRLLREENLLKENVVVIALTANAVVGARETYLSAGFQEYLTKPIRSDDLEKALARFLPEGSFVWKEKTKQKAQVVEETAKPEELKREEQKQEEPKQEKPKQEEPVREESFGDDEILEFAPISELEEKGEEQVNAARIAGLQAMGLSVQNGISYCGGEEAFYLEVVRDYVDSHPERKRELEEFFDQKDWKAYAVKVHSLKSASKTIGATETFERARELEEAAVKEDAAFMEANHHGFLEDYDALIAKIGSALLE